MLQRIRTSLTTRIFCITSLILLAASAVTFGIIALATPVSYKNINTSKFMEQVRQLPLLLSQVALKDSGPIIDKFISDTGAGVIITDMGGNVVETPSNLSNGLVQENSGEVDIGITVDAMYLDELYAEYDFNAISVISDNACIPFSFKDEDKEYLMMISASLEQTNQTIEALGQVAPWLMGIMFLFSLLCALFYSRYMTKPIVRLSDISKRMAELDFTWACEEKREDEIGVLGRSLNELSQRLTAALTDLQSANAALKKDIERERETERQRLAFFAAVSHELKTPVTILKGQLSGMLEGIDVYRDRDKYLSRSLQVTGRMEGLVQEILTVSRMESGGMEICRQKVDLGSMIQEQMALAADLAEQKRMETTLDLESGVTISADPALLKKAVDNLLSNAVFYAPEGALLSVRLYREAGASVLQVENSGSHIPDEALPHVFEAFYRVDGSRSRRTGGSGLGLYIVDMVLKRHGAKYKIENTDTGVCFSISFFS